MINLAWQPQVRAAHPSLGVNTIAELLAEAKTSEALGYAPLVFLVGQSIAPEQNSAHQMMIGCSASLGP